VTDGALLMTISDAPSWGVTYDCHSDDSRGVICNHKIFMIHATGFQSGENEWKERKREKRERKWVKMRKKMRKCKRKRRRNEQNSGKRADNEQVGLKRRKTGKKIN